MAANHWDSMEKRALFNKSFMKRFLVHTYVWTLPRPKIMGILEYRVKFVQSHFLNIFFGPFLFFLGELSCKKVWNKKIHIFCSDFFILKVTGLDKSWILLCVGIRIWESTKFKIRPFFKTSQALAGVHDFFIPRNLALENLSSLL